MQLVELRRSCAFGGMWACAWIPSLEAEARRAAAQTFRPFPSTNLDETSSPMKGSRPSCQHVDSVVAGGGAAFIARPSHSVPTLPIGKRSSGNQLSGTGRSGNQWESAKWESAKWESAKWESAKWESAEWDRATR